MNSQIEQLTSNNIVLNDFLNKTILDDITKYIDEIIKQSSLVETNNNEDISILSTNSILLNKELGRIRINLPLDLKIIKFLNEYVQSYNKFMSIQYAFFVEYNNKYGIPFLPPHLDQTSSKTTFNYQLRSNIDWSSFVEGKEIELKDNSGFWIDVRDQVHWRRPKVFEDGDFLQMIFFHFIDHRNQFSPQTKENSGNASAFWIEKELEYGYKYY